MKILSIAALAAIQLSALAPAQAAEMPRQQPAEQRIVEGVELDLAEAQAPAPAVETAPDSARALAAREDEPRKRKSTGDKVLTGAAVVLGVGALAVAGLLVAIFVN